MIINFDPTITGGFVHRIMRDERVAMQLKCKGVITEEDQHNLVKEILIAGLRDYEIDLNRLIVSSRKPKVKDQ